MVRNCISIDKHTQNQDTVPINTKTTGIVGPFILRESREDREDMELFMSLARMVTSRTEERTLKVQQRSWVYGFWSVEGPNCSSSRVNKSLKEE